MGLPVSLSFGGLSPSYCFVSFNKLGADIVAKITAILGGNFTGYAVQKDPPADHTIVWFRTNLDPNGTIEEILYWRAAAPAGWTPIDDAMKIFYADDIGAVNAMVVNYAWDVPAVGTVNPRFTLVEGLTVVTKAKITNTLAVTLNPNGLGATPVKKQDSGGKVDLIANEIVAGNIYFFVYDGTQFICINPTPVAIGVFVATDASTLSGRIALGTPFAVLHGGTPDRLGFIRWSVVCASANLTYAKDDELDLYSILGTYGAGGVGPVTDWDTPFASCVDVVNSKLSCVVDKDPNLIGLNVQGKDGSGDGDLDLGKWNLRVRWQVFPA